MVTADREVFHEVAECIPCVCKRFEQRSQRGRLSRPVSPICKSSRGLKMKKVVISLSQEEVIRLTRIILDDDKEESFIFLKESIAKKVNHATRPHCVPVFEASYKPGQKDKFKIKGTVEI